MIQIACAHIYMCKQFESAYPTNSEAQILQLTMS